MIFIQKQLYPKTKKSQTPPIFTPQFYTPGGVKMVVI